ncbi:MAG: serine/threonine-protein kinase [Thermoanaerobaculia bacterium]
MQSDSQAEPARIASSGGALESEEGRSFLQGRLATFARTGFAISGAFFFSNRLIHALAPSVTPGSRAALQTGQIFHLAATVALLAMWLAACGRPLPASVLRVVDSAGSVVVGWLFALQIPFTPVAYRPEAVFLLALIVLLLYRSAMIPSRVPRTAWIGSLSVAPVPALTYWIYARSSGTAAAWLYTYYALLWCAAAVLVATVTSRVIYGLQQTVRAARRLGQYTLVEKIGEGGMGTVYRACHALLRRPTAIKLLPPERAGEMNLKRFEREVQMTALLTSPHTVAVYDFGRTPDGVFYYAMEYLDGIDLETLGTVEGPLPPGRVVHILRQVCAALHEAHTIGLIHRDVKPANIILGERGGTSDFAKVVDFGLVKDVLGNRSLTLTAENAVAGTPHYMAPEVIRGGADVGASSDIYALGATAYFLLTGKPPFEGSPMDVFAHHLRTAPDSPSKRLGRPVPAQLEAAVLEALEKDPARRPVSVREFAERLAACDVEPWTEADASDWWRERGAQLRRTGAIHTPDRCTLDVDLLARE